MLVSSRGSGNITGVPMDVLKQRIELQTTKTRKASPSPDGVRPPKEIMLSAQELYTVAFASKSMVGEADG